MSPHRLVISKPKEFLLLAGAVFIALFSVNAYVGLLTNRLWPVIRALTAYIFYAIVLCAAYSTTPQQRRDRKKFYSLCLPQRFRNILRK